MPRAPKNPNPALNIGIRWEITQSFAASYWGSSIRVSGNKTGDFHEVRTHKSAIFCSRTSLKLMKRPSWVVRWISPPVAAVIVLLFNEAWRTWFNATVLSIYRRFSASSITCLVYRSLHIYHHFAKQIKLFYRKSGSGPASFHHVIFGLASWSLLYVSYIPSPNIIDI